MKNILNQENTISLCRAKACSYSTVMAEEPHLEGQAALGTTATWWQPLELQAWWPQNWLGGREVDSSRRQASLFWLPKPSRHS